MTAPLVDRSTGDVIPASDHNDVKTYIEDAGYRVNTSSLSIGGTQRIDTSGNYVGGIVYLNTGKTSYLHENADGDLELVKNGSVVQKW